MVIVVVKNFGGSKDAIQLQDKRPRAVPPDGWKGENKALKKRQTGERAVKLKHILKITTNQEIPETDKDEKNIPTDPPPENIQDESTKTPIQPTEKENEEKGEFRNKVKEKEENEELKEEEDWKLRLQRMRDEVKKVQELPKIIVPELLQRKTSTSASSPDLSIYSAKNNRTSRFESSWEIRAKYRNMRNEELYQSQTTIQSSGYSWRDRIPEMSTRKLKFSENKLNAVTERSFVGATYVVDKQDRISSEVPRFSRGTKSYAVDLAINLQTIQVKEKLPQVELPVKEIKSDILPGIFDQLREYLDIPARTNLLMITYPGYENLYPVKEESQEEEDDGLPELEEVPLPAKIEIFVEKVEPEVKDVGNIRSKMRGTIADLVLVDRKKGKTEKSGGINEPPKPPPTKSSGVTGGGDWRLEIKKRERAKQQEQLNAMKIGMPDYREPEKAKVDDWRDKLKEHEEANNPMNKWKKLDNGSVKKPRAPPPKPKEKEQTKEEPCTCNIGTCKQHSKFTLRLASVKKPDTLKVEEPLKRKPSPKKNIGSKVSNGTSKDTRGASVEKGRSSSLLKETLAPTEKKETVTRIINFVAIKISVEEDQKLSRKRSVKTKPKSPDKPTPPPPLEAPPPPPIESPPPPPKDPTPPPQPSPPPPTVKEPTPLPELPPTPPKEATPPLPITLTLPPPKPKSPSPPPYKSRSFPNPPKSEPYKVRHLELVKTTVKMKYVDEPSSPKYSRKRYSADVDVKPVKFSAVRENCVKKALFLGDQYMGPSQYEEKSVHSPFSILSPQVHEKSPSFIEQMNTFTSPYLKPQLWIAKDNTCDESNKPEADSPDTLDSNKRKRNDETETVPETISTTSSWRNKFRQDASTNTRELSPKFRNQTSQNKSANADGSKPGRKAKASTKIIDILSLKSREDKLLESDIPTSPCLKQPKRKLSEYVYEKLRQAEPSKSRSHTPGSPKTSRSSRPFSPEHSGQA